MQNNYCLISQGNYMKPEYFDYILEINRLHSISAAAKTLHIQQSTLRSIVKSIEDECGFLIFQRTPTCLITTPAGKQFMDVAWEISIRYNELLAIKQREIVSSSRAIKVITSPSTSTFLPCEIVKYFRRFELQGNLVFEEADKRTLESHILEHTSNIAISFLTSMEIANLQDQEEQGQFELKKILSDRLYLTVADSHPLARQAFVDVDSLYKERIAVCSIVRNDPVLGDFFYRKGLNITAFSDINLVCQAILEQKFVGLLPGYSVCTSSAYESGMLRMVNVKNTKHINQFYLCLLHLREKFLRYQEKVMLSCIQEYFQDFLKEPPEFNVCVERFP